jgi:hypothetical protein
MIQITRMSIDPQDETRPRIIPTSFDAAYGQNMQISTGTASCRCCTGPERPCEMQATMEMAATPGKFLDRGMAFSLYFNSLDTWRFKATCST